MIRAEDIVIKDLIVEDNYFVIVSEPESIKKLKQMYQDHVLNNSRKFHLTFNKSKTYITFNWKELGSEPVNNTQYSNFINGPKRDDVLSFLFLAQYIKVDIMVVDNKWFTFESKYEPHWYTSEVRLMCKS